MAEMTAEARGLLRGARMGTLATQSEGQPFAALVTPATTGAGDVILLLSDLSEHTRQLKAEPRCALLLTGPAPEPNPQTAPRLAVQATAAPDDDPALAARFLAIHPYAALYAGFGDFRIWRLRIQATNFVGGFARAARIPVDDLRPDPAAAAAIAAAESGIVDHCNSDHADAMETLGGGPGWRMTACDPDGVDLADGTRSRRFAFGAPVADPDGLRMALIGLIRAARQG